MKTNLAMGNNIIYNVKNDVNDDAVVNKGYVDQADNSLQNNTNTETDLADFSNYKKFVGDEFVKTEGGLDQN